MADVRTEYSQLAEQYDKQWDAYSLRTTEAVLADARLRATLLERPRARLLDVATGRCCSSHIHLCLPSNSLVLR
jgi:ubiquinone/menaquinone biosynthesis C-methylase UbiE